ncbi:hypothetical protein Taro_004969 [Colocasia esculenta]|uniref:Uncharacterized protein n=1 Tax=Colocasia esculenta TaxID=4460 RepID=A0A843TLR6_COLES|nr:hypothetical protein [Colocasia esculenta]
MNSTKQYKPQQFKGYNQLIDHVGTHGQRRLTEALNKDSLVRQKDYPTESSSKSRERYNQLVDHVGTHGHDEQSIPMYF